MRRCLAACEREGFVVPLDADDVLEPDALEVLAAAIDREHAADFVFSDEDHLGDAQRAPILEARVRSGPQHRELIHLASVARSAASGRSALGVYSDDAAELCHDWDTIVRFSEAGLR